MRIYFYIGLIIVVVILFLASLLMGNKESMVSNKIIKKIKQAIAKNKLENIEEIAKYSGCKYKECLIKIRYLKNMGYFEEYYIDSDKKNIRKCPPEDLKLLKKYHEDIYDKQLQIEEMAKERLKDNTNLEEVKNKVFNDLKYLHDREIINNIILDNDNKEIIYTTKDPKNVKWYKTFVCPNCGALVDVPKDSSERCNYCNFIVSDSEGDSKNV